MWIKKYVPNMNFMEKNMKKVFLKIKQNKKDHFKGTAKIV